MFYVFIFFIFFASYLQFFSSFCYGPRCFHLKSRTFFRCFLLLIEKSLSSNAWEAIHLSQSVFFFYSHRCFVSISLYVLLLFCSPTRCFVILWFPDSHSLAPCFLLTLDRPSPWRSPTISHTALSPSSLRSLLPLFCLLKDLVSIKWRWQQMVLVTVFLLPNIDEQGQHLTVLTIYTFSLSVSS